MYTEPSQSRRKRLGRLLLFIQTRITRGAETKGVRYGASGFTVLPQTRIEGGVEAATATGFFSKAVVDDDESAERVEKNHSGGGPSRWDLLTRITRVDRVSTPLNEHETLMSRYSSLFLSWSEAGEGGLQEDVALSRVSHLLYVRLLRGQNQRKSQGLLKKL